MMALSRRVLFAAGIFLAAAPARAGLPPLIPREVLYGNPEKADPRISPDGARLAWLAPSPEGVLNIWVQDLPEGEPRMVTDDRLRGIFGYAWAYTNRHLLYVQDKEGDENWHLYVSDLASGEVRDLTPQEGARVENIRTSPQVPEEALIDLFLRDPRYGDPHRVNLATGKLTMEAENPGDVTEWAADRALRVRTATALDPGTSDTILRYRDKPGGKWRDMVRWPFLEAGEVVYRKVLGFAPDGKGLYAQTCMNGDKSRIVVLDPATGGELQTIAADDRCDVWNYWWEPVILAEPRTGRIQAVGIHYEKPEWRVVDPAIAGDLEFLREHGDDIVKVESRDLADSTWIVSFSSDVRTPSYYVYRRGDRKLDFLFHTRPELEDYAFAEMLPRWIDARDGRRIPCYLTLPVGVESKGLPLVLMPHGGPWAQDYWEFTPDAQLLANRGYAVLQVNFRGSTGYGKDHLNAGIGQWGVGSMQHDLTDAVLWAIDKGIADPRRVAIFGGSYGGYATLCGIAFTPELYACAVDVVGPSNVATLFQSFPPYWQVRKTRWKLRVGDVESDAALNERISPLFHAEAIRVPALIAHGANDPRVKLSESEAIVAAMRKNGVPVTFVVYPDEGHGMGRPENALDFTARLEEFLALHLGGRAEPRTEVPGSSAEAR
jgi:dipeptidyl aminopeptidase/acylaminoacyl peptidase